MEDDKVLTEPTGCHTRGVWSNDVKWGWLNNSNATLWQTYKKLWKIPIFNGKIHYKWSFSIAMLNYQRVHGPHPGLMAPRHRLSTPLGVGSILRSSGRKKGVLLLAVQKHSQRLENHESTWINCVSICSRVESPIFRMSAWGGWVV